MHHGVTFRVHTFVSHRSTPRPRPLITAGTSCKECIYILIRFTEGWSPWAARSPCIAVPVVRQCVLRPDAVPHAIILLTISSTCHPIIRLSLLLAHGMVHNREARSFRMD